MGRRMTYGLAEQLAARGHFCSDCAVERKAESMVKYYNLGLKNRTIGMIQAIMSQSQVAKTLAPLSEPC